MGNCLCCGSTTLYVNIISAANLPDMDIGGASDAYVIVKLVNKKTKEEHDLKKFMCFSRPLKTKYVASSKSPLWNCTLPFKVPGNLGDFELMLEVWDWDRLTRDDFIGVVRAQLDSGSLGQEQSHAIELKDGKGKAQGSVKFLITSKNPSTDKTPLTRA